MRLTSLLPVLGLAQLATSAPSFVSQYELDAGGSRGGGQSLMDMLREDKRFSCFVEALEKEKGLRDDLERGEKTTVFAPTNDGWRRAMKEWKTQGKGSGFEMKDILQYHAAPESDISWDCLHAGALVPTSLRLKSLGDRHQRLRVFKFADRTWLNMRAMVMDEAKAANGRIFATDHVLLPPPNAAQMMMALPTEFSTYILGLEITGLTKDACRETGLTILAPNNAAWKSLGLSNLKYLFSCIDQETSDRRGKDENKPECRGTRDLRRILENSMFPGELSYSTDIAGKGCVQMKSIAGEKTEICAKERTGHRASGLLGQHKDVRNFNFVVNKGESLLRFTDLLTSNGNVHVTTNVLIPEGVRLPHGDRMMEMEL
ncbi:hypothetical protein BDZ88DRAFT_472594 [Geranomyces variabilis]|nr:hypothetical protein BDZ88DRAFT_472594 [Geranomyces variabilis]KAJ3141546.1 hypothetical protein HDU90_005888 [Geranomyces variabilis]